MPISRRILTLHSPVPTGLLDGLLTAIEAALLRSGASRVWLDYATSPELVVMAELPDGTTPGAAATACTEGEHISVIPPPR